MDINNLTLDREKISERASREAEQREANAEQSSDRRREALRFKKLLLRKQQVKQREKHELEDKGKEKHLNTEHQAGESTQLQQQNPAQDVTDSLDFAVEPGDVDIDDDEIEFDDDEIDEYEQESLSENTLESPQESPHTMSAKADEKFDLPQDLDWDTEIEEQSQPDYNEGFSDINQEFLVEPTPVILENEQDAGFNEFRKDDDEEEEETSLGDTPLGIVFERQVKPDVQSSTHLIEQFAEVDAAEAEGENASRFAVSQETTQRMAQFAGSTASDINAGAVVQIDEASAGENIDATEENKKRLSPAQQVGIRVKKSQGVQEEVEAITAVESIESNEDYDLDDRSEVSLERRLEVELELEEEEGEQEEDSDAESTLPMEVLLESTARADPQSMHVLSEELNEDTETLAEEESIEQIQLESSNQKTGVSTHSAVHGLISQEATQRMAQLALSTHSDVNVATASEIVHADESGDGESYEEENQKSKSSKIFSSLGRADGEFEPIGAVTAVASWDEEDSEDAWSELDVSTMGTEEGEVQGQAIVHSAGTSTRETLKRLLRSQTSSESNVKTKTGTASVMESEGYGPILEVSRDEADAEQNEKFLQSYSHEEHAAEKALYDEKYTKMSAKRAISCPPTATELQAAKTLSNLLATRKDSDRVALEVQVLSDQTCVAENDAAVPIDPISYVYEEAHEQTDQVVETVQEQESIDLQEANNDDDSMLHEAMAERKRIMDKRAVKKRASLGFEPEEDNSSDFFDCVEEENKEQTRGNESEYSMHQQELLENTQDAVDQSLLESSALGDVVLQNMNRMIAKENDDSNLDAAFLKRYLYKICNKIEVLAHRAFEHEQGAASSEIKLKVSGELIEEAYVHVKFLDGKCTIVITVRTDTIRQYLLANLSTLKRSLKKNYHEDDIELLVSVADNEDDDSAISV